MSMAVAGNQKVTAAKFKVTAANDSYTIQEVKLLIPTALLNSVAVSSVIKNVTLLDGTTELATKAFDVTTTLAADTASFTGLNLVVPANTSKVLTVQLDLSQPSADYATTGLDTQIQLYYVKVANSQGVTSEPTAARTANYLYVYKSIPTFTVGSVGTSQGVNLASGATTSLYNFSAKADAKGDIALKQLKFTVSITDPNGTDGSLNTFKLFRGSTDITSSVTIQNTSAVSLESTGANISGTSSTVVVTFDTEEQIPAGSSYSYTLKATPSNFAGDGTNGYDSVSVSMPTDSTPANVAVGVSATNLYTYGTSNTGVQTLATSTAGANSTAANVIWSDLSAVGHSYTYNASSTDWFNGYLIENLPLDSIGIVANQ